VASTKLGDLATHLESIGLERVPMVDDVAQFSIRGGIFDVYSFGMAEPVRAEFWGDEIVDLKHFDLSSQRSTRAVDFAMVLPVDGHAPESEGATERRSILSLLPTPTRSHFNSARHARRSRADSDVGRRCGTISSWRAAAVKTSPRATNCSRRPPRRRRQ